jgi:sulfur-oxidizing protein SoxA
LLIVASFALLAAPAARAQDETERAVEKYRQMLKEDPWSNPALLDADRGEALWKTPGGPNRLSLERCDLGKGPGVVDGAFAELPRYFADADRVMDVETRLLWCMEKLQGANRADLVRSPHPGGGQPVKDLGAIATYVASKSNGMKYAAKLDQAKEKEAVELGRAIFFRRQGPHDFACATCHADTGKRIRPGPAPSDPARGSAQGDRRVACLPRLKHACHDHAASAVRLLLADADAAARNGIGRERGADRLSHQDRGGWRDRRPRPEAIRSAPCGSSQWHWSRSSPER